MASFFKGQWTKWCWHDSLEYQQGSNAFPSSRFGGRRQVGMKSVIAGGECMEASGEVGKVIVSGVRI